MKKSTEDVFEKCRKMRDLPEELKHRVFYDFGFFLQEMVNYFIWGRLSDVDELREFQKTIDVNDYDSNKFDTYLKLFEKFYEWMNKNEDDCER